ncbi:MAG: RluA family pseudouridine synthase [Pseudomonadota bacterium]
MPDPEEKFEVTHDGPTAERLDKLLGQASVDHSRARFQMLISQGHVNVDGTSIVDASFKVKPGSVVCVALPEAEDPKPLAEDIALNIVHEDSQIVVVDKPAGLVVHPGPGNWTGTLVNALIAHCGDSLSGIGGVKRPGIVHRLDKETSGLLVVAKTDKAHRALSEQFAAHGRDGRLSRQYLAIVWGEPQPRRGIIDTLIARSTANRIKMAVAKSAGRRAITHYETVRPLPAGTGDAVASLVRCQLETGRTHQIRVHLAHIGHPLLGDRVYGSSHAASANKLNPAARASLASLSRQALHAETLGFEHPETGEPMSFRSALPEDMRDLAEKI